MNIAEQPFRKEQQELICWMYRDEGMGMVAIARALQVGTRFIRQTLTAHGIPIRGQHEPGHGQARVKSAEDGRLGNDTWPQRRAKQGQAVRSKPGHCRRCGVLLTATDVNLPAAKDGLCGYCVEEEKAA